MKKVLVELQELKEQQSRKNSPNHILCTLLDDGTWKVHAQFDIGTKKYTSKDYNLESIKQFKNLFPDLDDDTVCIYDDMVVEPDEMYIGTGIILLESKEIIQRFIDLALNHSEMDYMKAYIELFNEKFGVDEPDYSWKYPGSIRRFDGKRWSTDEEEKQKHFERERKDYADSVESIRNVLKVSPLLLDFFDNYKKLTVEELVERYKDQRFFRKEGEEN